LRRLATVHFVIHYQEKLSISRATKEASVTNSPFSHRRAASEALTVVRSSSDV